MNACTDISSTVERVARALCADKWPHMGCTVRWAQDAYILSADKRMWELCIPQAEIAVAAMTAPSETGQITP